MQLLATLDDYHLGLSPSPRVTDEGYVERQAARAIIFNNNNDIALLHARHFGYHKLPGGGIEEGETWQEAVLREAIEETGTVVALRPLEIGQVIEYRGRRETWHPDIPRLRQISYCGVADVIQNAVPTLTDEENRVGLAVEWMPLDQAIHVCESDTPRQDQDQPDNYEGRFILARDLCFLKKARQVLAGG